MHHPNATSQFVADRRSALLAAGLDHRAARPERTTDPVLGPDADPCVVATITAAIPSPGTAGFAAWAADFGDRIATDGVVMHHRRVSTLATLARHLSVELVSAAVAADRTQPAVARERAVGRLLVALSATPCPASSQRVA